jgi:hypothetical protein
MVDFIPMPDHDAEEIKRRLQEREAEDKRVETAINERTKLTAGMLSQLGVVFLTIGVITPLFTDLTKLTSLGSAICIIGWLGLHLIARWSLKGLK